MKRGAAVAAGRLQPLPIGVGQPGRIETEDGRCDVLTTGEQATDLTDVAVAWCVDDAVGVQSDDCVVVGGCGDADRVPADKRPGIHSILGFGIDLHANDFEVVAVVDHRGQQLTADRPWPPENHPVRLVSHGGDDIRVARRHGEIARTAAAPRCPQPWKQSAEARAEVSARLDTIASCKRFSSEVTPWLTAASLARACAGTFDRSFPTSTWSNRWSRRC